MNRRGHTDHELALRAVGLLDELAHLLASIPIPTLPDRPTTLFTLTRHNLQEIRRAIGDLDQFTIRDQHRAELHRRPLEWRIAPADADHPATLFAVRPGLGSVALPLDPAQLRAYGWHYVGELARQMTEALS